MSGALHHTAEALSLWKGPIRRPVTMEEVAEAVAKRHGLTLDDLCGHSKRRAVAWPRQEAFAEIYAKGLASLPVIGQFFGERDHSTVHSGIRRHEERAALRNAEVEA